MLKPVKPVLPGDAHTIVLYFVAQPPPSNQAVIPGLLPVRGADGQDPGRGIGARTSAVNEITTQI